MKSLSYILTFVAGAAAGVGGCYYFLNTKLKTSYEKKLQKEIDESMDILKKDSDKKVIKEINKKVEEAMTEEKYEHYVPISKEEKTSYNDYTKNYKSDEEEDEDVEEPEWAQVVSGPQDQLEREMAHPTPYIITEDEHFEMKPAYDLIQMTWDPYEGELYDDGGFLVEDPDQMVGLENLEEVAKSPTNEILVRNDGLMTDFEVMLKDIE